MNNNFVKSNFYEKGWCKVPNFFDQDFICKIKAESDKVLREISNFYEVHYTNNKNNSESKVNTIHDLSVNSEFFRNLLHDKKIIKLIEYILDDEIQPQWSQLFNKPAKFGMKSPFHQDNYYWNVEENRTVTMWIAIDKVYEDNGALSYYENSHKLGLVSHVDSFQAGSSQKVSGELLSTLSKDSLVTPKMEPGDVLLHHGAIIHGSKANLSNYDRRGMSMWYKAKSASINEKNLLLYKKSLKNQNKHLSKEK
jgi:phytanoyl-CoA hydroxylase